MGSYQYSIPVENLEGLVEKLKTEMGSKWNGKSDSVKVYFQGGGIHPPTHGDFKQLFSSERHTLATSYVWSATSLEDIVSEVKKPKYSGKRIWIDIFINDQTQLQSSAVMDLTNAVYKDCEVLIMLSPDTFKRGWCLYEALNYVRNRCTLHTVGICKFLQTENFFQNMQTREEQDKIMIRAAIERHYGNDFEKNFNLDVQDAVVTVYSESLLQAGHFQEALEVSLQRLRLEESTTPNSINTANTMNSIGRAYQNLGLYKQALEMYERELKIEQDKHGNNHVSVSATKINIANVYQAQGRYEEALKEYEQAHEIDIKCRGNDHVSVAGTKKNIGIVYRKQGKYDEALKNYEEALAIEVKCLGNNDVSVADTKNNIALVYDSLGKYEEALKMYEESLAVTIKCLGKDHVSVATTEMNIGNVHQALGQHEEALIHLNKALRINVSQLGNDHVSVSATKVNIANVYQEQGRYEEALKEYEQSLEIDIKCLGSDHVSVANTKYNIAFVEIELGNKLKAKQLFSEAATIFQQVYGKEHSETIDAWNQAKQLD